MRTEWRRGKRLSLRSEEWLASRCFLIFKWSEISSLGVHVYLSGSNAWSFKDRWVSQALNNADPRSSLIQIYWGPCRFFSEDESCWVDGSMSIPLAKGSLLSKGTAFIYDIHWCRYFIRCTRACWLIRSQGRKNARSRYSVRHRSTFHTTSTIM